MAHCNGPEADLPKLLCCNSDVVQVLPDTTDLDDGTSVFNTAPADEKAVFSRMYQILGSVSSVAASCGYGEGNVAEMRCLQAQRGFQCVDMAT